MLSKDDGYEILEECRKSGDNASEYPFDLIVVPFEIIKVIIERCEEINHAGE